MGTSQQTWHDRLERERRALFVGREAELARLSDFVRSNEGGHLHIEGPGGSGKTSLLGQFLAALETEDQAVVHVDGANFEPSPQRMRREVEHADRLEILIVDTFERLEPIHRWFRQELLPSLPDDLHLVTAGREELPAEHWGDYEEISLDDLDDAAARTFLQRRGVPAEQRESLIRATRGYPLALNLAATLTVDERLEPDEVDAEALAPLVDRLIAETPDKVHRRALWAASMVRITTPVTLRAMLEGVEPKTVDELYQWLASRSFIYRDSAGLRPHSLVREVLAQHFRDTAPAELQQMLRAARATLIETYLSADGPDAEARYLDLCYLHRNEPGSSQMMFEHAPNFYMDDVADDELHLVVDAVAEHEGPDNAELAECWLERHPEGLYGCRDRSGALVGFILYLELEKVGPQRREDPALRCLEEYLSDRGPLRPGESARVARYWMDLENHQKPSPVQTRLFVHMAVHLMAEYRRSIGTSVHAWPERWLPRHDRNLEYFGEFQLDDIPFVLLGADGRRHAPHRWYDYFFESFSSAPGHGPTCRELEKADVLDRQVFAEGVADALDDLHQTDRLIDNPLLRSRMLLERTPDGAAPQTRVEVLQRLLRQAIERLETTLSESGLTEGILRTSYLEATEKQFEAAHELDVPLSTYRRHLDRAVAELVERLWSLETGATSSEHFLNTE